MSLVQSLLSFAHVTKLVNAHEPVASQASPVVQRFPSRHAVPTGRRAPDSSRHTLPAPPGVGVAVTSKSTLQSSLSLRIGFRAIERSMAPGCATTPGNEPDSYVATSMIVAYGSRTSTSSPPFASETLPDAHSGYETAVGTSGFVLPSSTSGSRP